LCIRRAKIVDNNPSQDCCVYVEPKLLTITRNKKESQDYYYGYRKNETKQLAAPTSPFSLHFQNIIKQNIGCHPMASKWLLVPHQPHRSLIMHSSIIWANLLWKRATTSGFAATCLVKNPMVQSIVPSRTRTTLCEKAQCDGCSTHADCRSGHYLGCVAWQFHHHVVVLVHCHFYGSRYRMCHAPHRSASQ
jgi:hypothetical protein